MILSHARHRLAVRWPVKKAALLRSNHAPLSMHACSIARQNSVLPHPPLHYTDRPSLHSLGCDCSLRLGLFTRYYCCLPMFVLNGIVSLHPPPRSVSTRWQRKLVFRFSCLFTVYDSGREILPELTALVSQLPATISTCHARDHLPFVVHTKQNEVRSQSTSQSGPRMGIFLHQL